MFLSALAKLAALFPSSDVLPRSWMIRESVCELRSLAHSGCPHPGSRTFAGVSTFTRHVSSRHLPTSTGTSIPASAAPSQALPSSKTDRRCDVHNTCPEGWQRDGKSRSLDFSLRRCFCFVPGRLNRAARLAGSPTLARGAVADLTKGRQSVKACRALVQSDDGIPRQSGTEN